MIESFDTRTCADDFAGPGRVVEVRDTKDSGYAWRGMRVRMANGWTLSAQWGFGSYSHGARDLLTSGVLAVPPRQSATAEVAAWKDDGDMIELAEDTVAGYQTPAAVLAAIEAAERDDEDGIRRAFGWRGAIA